MKKLQIFRLIVQVLYIILGVTLITGRNKILGLTFLISSLLLGPFFCGWLCPFGTVQELFGKIGNFFIKKKPRLPQNAQKYFVFMRYILTAILMLMPLAVTGAFDVMQYDSRVVTLMLMGGKAVETMGVALLIVFVLVSVFFDRPFCAYFCAEGARYGFLSMLRLFTIKRNEKTCINCKKCDKVCPMNIIISDKKRLRHAQCINCFECISACPVKGTLKYNFAFNRAAGRQDA